MATIKNTSTSKNTGTKSTKSTTITNWHKILLWFLGALVLIALAGPAPKISIGITSIIIMLVLLKNWPTYSAYLGMSKG